MKKHLAVIAAAVTVAISSAGSGIANAGPGPNISGSGEMSVKTGREQLCLTALGSDVVVAKPCLTSLEERNRNGQTWEISRYSGFVQIAVVDRSGECLGDRSDQGDARLVNCAQYNEDGYRLRYVAMGTSACPGIDTKTSGCAEITLKNGYKLTAWVASMGHAESYSVVRWEDDPAGMQVRFNWAVPRLTQDHG